jgi:hypothetical protein
MVHRGRIKHKFNEQFSGFHFYDLPICIENHLDGVKIGVTTKIKVTHKSIGQISSEWVSTKEIFENKYKEHFPLVV